MPGHLISHSDQTGLDNYMKVLQRLPEFTRSFKVNLDLVPVREYGSYRIPEIAELLKKAREHLSLWPEALSAIHTLHQEIETFIEGIMQLSGNIGNSQGVKPGFIRHSQDGLGSFLDTLDIHQKTLHSLTQGIYTILPRVIDFLNENIYRHAHEYKLIGQNPDHNTAIQKLTASLSFAQNGPALSPQARLNGARYYVQTVQKQYAESYSAASNLNAHMARLSGLLAQSFAHSLIMRRTQVHSRPYLELKLMLVSLREAQRLSQWFKSLKDSPVEVPT